MNLFELGPFPLPSGEITHFKIECDVLTEGDWAALARLAVEILPPFGRVEGVPRGGIPFANALRPYVTEGPLLIADDVWVTGRSMNQYRAGHVDAIGIVAFTRRPVDAWVSRLFHMNPRAEEAAYRFKEFEGHTQQPQQLIERKKGNTQL